MKLLILLNCYNNHNVIINVYNFILNLMKKEDFDIYLINNNENINKEELIKYSKFGYIFKGNNACFEFSGIQKCLEFLKKENKIELYDITLLITDALFNNPITYLNFVNIETFKYVFENEVCVGNIDSFGKKCKIDNFVFEYWIRTCFVIINNKLFKKIDYKFLSYKYYDVYNENNVLKINVDNNLQNTLNNRLMAEQYKYLDNENKKNLKKLCIYNEYSFTKKIKEFSEIYDIFYIYLINVNKCKYINKIENLENLKPMEQIKIRNSYLL